MAKMQQKINHKEFARLAKELKPYVNYDFSKKKIFTKSQRERIQQDYNDFQAKAGTGRYVIYRPRSKKALGQVKSAVNDFSSSRFKVVFVPKIFNQRPRVRLTKDGATLTTISTNRRFIAVDHAKLFTRQGDISEKYVQAVLKGIKGRVVSVAFYGNESLKTYDNTPGGIKNMVRGLQAMLERYQDTSANPFEDENFLRGFYVWNFVGQADTREFTAKRDKWKRASGELAEQASKKRKVLARKLMKTGRG